MLYIYFLPPSPPRQSRNTNTGGKKLGQRFVGCNYISLFSFFPPPFSRESRIPSIDISIGLDEARMNIQGLGMCELHPRRTQIFLSMQYANIIHRHAPSVPFFPWRGPPGDPVRIIPHLTLTTRPTILHPRSFYLSPLVATFSKRWFLETRESIRSCTVELVISENRVKRLFWIFCQN